MAVIGQVLTAPEAGYSRYLFTDINFQYGGAWVNNSGNDMVSSIKGDTIKFNFYGDSIYVLVYAWANRGEMTISIDGEPPIKYTGNVGGSLNVVAFVANNLGDSWHDVTITVVTDVATLRAIDVKGSIAPYNENVRPQKRLVLKNPTTNQHYSLADKTLIQLPNASDKNMILHGVEEGKEIKLDEAFDKIHYIQNVKEELGVGKVFSHNINALLNVVRNDTGNILILSRFLILHDNTYKYYNGTDWVVIGSTVMENDYITYGMSDLSIVPSSKWRELDGVIQIKEYVDGVLEYSVLKAEVEPYSVYDYISDTPTAIVYTDYTHDITVSTATEPYDLYEEFGDEVEVLYYTDDESVVEADLILEANWSPIDELEGDFEVVTWTDEQQETAQRVLEMTAIPKPQFIKIVEPYMLYGNLSDILAVEDSETYRFKNPVRYLFCDESKTNWYKWNSKSEVFEITDVSTIEKVKENGMTNEDLDAITEAQWVSWSESKLGIGIYLYDNPRDTIVSVVDKISFDSYIPRDTVNISDSTLYVLNTTARIDLEIDGNTITGRLDDADLTKVQYKVSLNGNAHFPTDGSFTNLSASPTNISLSFPSSVVKIDDWNTVRVEFKDSFGTTDYWQAQFIGTYAGLMFKDVYGDYYSSEIGEVLQYLDFGTIIAGQTTIEHEVILKNQYGYDVKNIQLSANTSEFPSGMSMEFSTSLAPFTPSPDLKFSNVLANGDELSFYVRIKTTLGATPNANGAFDIIVRADEA